MMPDDAELRDAVNDFIARVSDLLIRMHNAIEDDDLDEQRMILEALVGCTEQLKQALNLNGPEAA
jgi:hypothetical protein